MTESRRPFDATQPEPIDDNEDRMGSMRELDFDEDEPSTHIGDERAREAGLTEASTNNHEPTDDDMSPETLIREDGARDAREEGEDNPADFDLSIVDEAEIGGGNGLDEAELADLDPVGEKR
ncbi:serine kinase/phosphatase [Pseudomonas poae]|uniref:Serine kinase/phosphatase n=1 Tax=Pseudomonas poae TaxID=200451 RepID=A0A423FHC0_9PSED|nr:MULTISPECIES: serine kinase/phosphatase [Pseudomonas]ROM57416.1 serine kinase/phosphatase [Pseudomonas poae]TFF10254.1 serine kinase/phosphatase [Pseudomonas sp. JMN1]TFF12396.1 serine kinase/phosphatase [Pseudomonas sp. BCA17]TFF25727.1 serine kinase/phosphatase [Pseudomonas sp. BCA13]TFF29172.1 serine kinase/phosphatase [Pseudomonas sp. BCA14]